MCPSIPELASGQAEWVVWLIPWVPLLNFHFPVPTVLLFANQLMVAMLWWDYSVVSKSASVWYG